jgi:hypothetical protein
MKTNKDLIEHLLGMLDETKELIEEDLMLVNQSANKLIVELESIIFYSKQSSAKKITEPDFNLLENELTTLISRFKEANLKKKFMLNIRDWGKEMISQMD